MEANGNRAQALAELKGQLRSLRAQRRLSMAALSWKAGLGRTTISQALNGTSVPSEATVARLASALGTEAEPLLRLRARVTPPSATAPAERDGTTRQATDTFFENWYRQYVEHRYKQLSVIGLDLSRPERACWPLDAAYLSLEFATSVQDVAATASHDALGRGLEGGVRVERAEQALAGRRRTLVRGLAGSGKTTLLQWLAVATARRNLPPELAHVQDCLPFILPLRTLVRRGTLPDPHEYLAATGCPREGSQPSGWVDELLLDGRAILLLDGLDEVPQAQREQTRQWLRNLLAAYPKAAYLVTTRPSAVPEGWLADSSFTELTVRPMNSRDVAVFVTRWHAASAALACDPQERIHLATLEDVLKDTVRSQRDLARLATTPLLCALVCALHRDRRGHLPHGRMELYEAALSMLLHRRDRERDIGSPEGLTLTEHQSIQLLQRLAYWLIRNGQTELDHDTARTLISDALPAMPHVAEQADADDVLTHLVARSGLLRQPTADTVDFVHRTFQDYLGAKAAIESRDIPLLVQHAHDDQWEDVLRMAVAHARPRERATLLRRLITRGDRTRKHRTRLYLLATACLGHATELDPAVREEVQQRAAALLPPRSKLEARDLAAAGPVILDLLPGPEGLDDEEAEAVVRTAAHIGGDAALTIMKRFRKSTNGSVTWALSQSWDRFDTEDYAREVLTHLPELPFLPIHSPEELVELHALPTPERLLFQGNFMSHDIADAVITKGIRHLEVWDNLALGDLNFLRACTSVTDFDLRNCPNIRELAPLADTAVTDLHLRDVGSLSGLQTLHNLRFLHLGMELPHGGLRKLPISAELHSLMLSSASCQSLGTLSGLSRWPSLSTVNLCGPLDDISSVSALPNLHDLVLQLDAGLFMLEDFTPAPQIKTLWLGKWDKKDELSLVRRALPGLTKLDVRCYPEGGQVDLTPLRGMPDLTITVTDAREVLGTEHFPPEAVTRWPRPRN